MVFYFLIALHLAQVFDDKYKSGLIELHGAPKAPIGSENTFTTSFFRQTTQFFVCKSVTVKNTFTTSFFRPTTQFFVCNGQKHLYSVVFPSNYSILCL
jgi:hypothetical protein